MSFWLSKIKTSDSDYCTAGQPRSPGKNHGNEVARLRGRTVAPEEENRSPSNDWESSLTAQPVVVISQYFGFPDQPSSGYRWFLKKKKKTLLV